MTTQSNPTPWRPPAGPGRSGLHPVGFPNGDVAIAIVGVILLLGGPAGRLFATRNTDPQREALLRQRGVDAAAVITRVWQSSGNDRHMVAYRFTAEHGEWSGEASVPLRIWTSLHRGAPLAIRYVRGWPDLNHPVEWAPPYSFGWMAWLKGMVRRRPCLLRLDRATDEALQRWADADVRSLNAQIEFLLRRALIDAGRLKPLPEVPPVESEP